MKKRFKLSIAYAGSRYFGWQAQKNAKTVQQTLEKALSQVTQKSIRIQGSGRTDAGVHALGQVAHFDTENPPSLKEINNSLPEDIRALSINKAPPSFHARYSAKGKIYEYHLQIAAIHNPFLYRFTHHIKTFDKELVQEKIKVITGKHDFKSFTNQGSSPSKTIKHLKKISIEPTPYGVKLVFKGDGFLYKMVRNLSWALLDSSISQKGMKTLLESKDRKQAGKPAPAKGLFLSKVLYEEDPL